MVTSSILTPLFNTVLCVRSCLSFVVVHSVNILIDMSRMHVNIVSDVLLCFFPFAFSILPVTLSEDFRYHHRSIYKYH